MLNRLSSIGGEARGVAESQLISPHTVARKMHVLMCAPTSTLTPAPVATPTPRPVSTPTLAPTQPQTQPRTQPQT